jgi:aryl-alcohol dehydrogenase-like predicted oxidoreductase
MRLSTSPDRDDARSIEVIRAALDAGATLLDTADAYCRADDEIGHNERLIAEALRGWEGDRATVEVATKGGLRRPGGQWVADAKAKSLRAACEASRRALDVDVIDLYQLHAVDPKTPFETSVRALAALQSEGKVRRVGLCNVTVGQIEAARAIVEIASVQVSLSPLDEENLRNGVAEYCRDHGIRLIAHRPLGGDRVTRLTRDPALVDIAASYDATPPEVALAWLMDLSPVVVPIPGATRVETAQSIGRALHVRLGDDDRRRLDERFSGRLLRVPRSMRRPPDDSDGEVVLVMGMPGAGKSTTARALEADGYERLNRDARGGSLSDLATELDQGLGSGRKRWVLDNTYPSRKSRNEVIETAWEHGVPVRCVWVTATIADAQINAVTRMIAAYGSLPSPEEIREHGKADARYFGPDAQFRYERTAEPPVADEGFTSVEERPFVRAVTPNATERAIVLDYDEVCASLSIAERIDVLRRHRAGGWLVFAHAWRPDVARGKVSLDAVRADFERTRDLLDLDIELACCPHDAGPPICWCRRPLPGLVLEFALQRGVALHQSVVVGGSAADRTMAQRLGMVHRELDEFSASFRT